MNSANCRKKIDLLILVCGKVSKLVESDCVETACVCTGKNRTTRLEKFIDKMSIRLAEKKENVIKNSSGIIGNVVNSSDDVCNGTVEWQNGQNLLVVTQDTQGKELIAIADNQTINVAVDSYCSYFYLTIFFYAILKPAKKSIYFIYLGSILFLFKLQHNM